MLKLPLKFPVRFLAISVEKKENHVFYAEGGALFRFLHLRGFCCDEDCYERAFFLMQWRRVAEHCQKRLVFFVRLRTNMLREREI